MNGVNEVTIIGHLGKDPETRYMPAGGAVTNITVATKETWKEKATGEQKEQTEWHRIVFFNKLAEIANQYLKRGMPVYIKGALKTRKWQDSNGQDRYTTEIVASEMQMLGSRKDSDHESSYERPTKPSNTPKKSNQRVEEEYGDQDIGEIPF